MSKADFIHKIKIARKEAKETVYWLKLLDTTTDCFLEDLVKEAIEIEKVLGAIRIKAENNS
jgi:four helix bundle protein